MLDPIREILGLLTSKGDWAVVVGAGLVGAGVDLFLVNIGILSPGECAMAAAGSALTAKHGWEAHRDLENKKRIVKSYIEHAEKLTDDLKTKKKSSAADALSLAIEIAKIDGNPAALRSSINAARAQL